MSSPAHQSIEPDHGDPYADDFQFVDDDEIDDFSDPFVILAAREERAGVPLIYLDAHYDD